jgi:hypothetical protein
MKNGIPKLPTVAEAFLHIEPKHTYLQVNAKKTVE